MTASLYSLRSTSQPGEFTILKFSPDYDVESVYALSEKTCTCPQGHKPKCKHRTMLRLFLTQAHVDDGWFLDWSTRLWRHPIGEAELTAECKLADTTIMGNAGQEETIAKRVAGGFASEGANAVLAREARSNPPPQAASSNEPQAIQRSLATPAPDPTPSPIPTSTPGELRRRRF